jgi:hypothetical protein
MTTEPKTTALTADEARAQVHAWIAAGLPKGKVYCTPTDRRLIYCQPPDLAGVAAWAVALGQGIEFGGGVISAGPLGRVEPLDLPGWVFNVWCDAPEVRAELKIATRELAS